MCMKTTHDKVEYIIKNGQMQPAESSGMKRIKSELHN